jgi:hypothetical protein
MEAARVQAGADDTESSLVETQTSEQQSIYNAKKADLEQTRHKLTAATCATTTNSMKCENVIKEQASADTSLAAVEAGLSEKTSEMIVLEDVGGSLSRQSCGAEKDIKTAEAKVAETRVTLFKLEESHASLSGQKARADLKLANYQTACGSSKTAQAQLRTEALKANMEAMVATRRDGLVQLELQQKAKDSRDRVDRVKEHVQQALAALLSADAMENEQARLRTMANMELDAKDAKEKLKLSKKRGTKIGGGGGRGGGGNSGEDDCMQGIRVGLEQEMEMLKAVHMKLELELEDELKVLKSGGKSDAMELALH